MQTRRPRPAATGDGGTPRQRPKRFRRSWPQRLVIAFNIVVVIVCLGSAWALGFYSKQWSDVPRIALQGVLDPITSDTAPQNFLLVGVDNAEGLDPNDPVLAGRDPGENLSDAIMILRIDPNQQKAAMLSLPRDLYVTIAGNRGKDKINTALAFGNGQPDLLIQTIKANFDIEINHYLQVNFAAFRSLVDALGGVNIWFDHPARDPKTGLSQLEVGPDGECKRLTGTEALSFARSRTYEAQIDGRWVLDETVDLGRIARQQYFIKQAAKKAIARGARNPIELNNLIGIAQENMKIDDALTAQQILDLGERFNTFNPEDLEVFTPAVTRKIQPGGADTLILDEASARPIFDIFRGVNPLFNAVGATRVGVVNGTGRVGQGQQAADELEQRGFPITGVTDDRGARHDVTVLRYAPGENYLRAAVLVARYLDGSPRFEEDDSLAGTDTYVSVLLGRDFQSIRTDPRPVEDFQAVLDAATTTSSPGTTAPPTVTTTTAVPPASQSFVPHPPPGADC